MGAVLDPLRHLDEELGDLAARSLLREPPAPRSPRPSAPALLDLCSNDYLGYAAEPWPVSARRFLGGRSGVRVRRGRRLAPGQRKPRGPRGGRGRHRRVARHGGGAPLLLRLRRERGRHLGPGRPGDVIVSDALNHASIIDGCRLSGATVRVVPHRDTAAVAAALAARGAARRRWVVTESYFSMDGDSPDLARPAGDLRRHDAALIVDEAHALGVFGPEGAGLCAAAGVRPDVLVGTAGKALGLQGAFVPGSRALRLWLWNRARSFVFSTGVSPALAAAIATRAVRARGDRAGRARLEANAARLREGLAGLGVLGVREGSGPVIPWVVGEPEAALRISRRPRRARRPRPGHPAPDGPRRHRAAQDHGDRAPQRHRRGGGAPCVRGGVLGERGPAHRRGGDRHGDREDARRPSRW